MNELELQLFANEIRKNLIMALASKGGGHIGGTLSICDLVAVLYGDIMKYRSDLPDWEERDYLICSKGHAAPAIYSALAIKGFFPMEWLKDLNKGGTNLPGHSDRIKVPGIDATTGSLGQGLSIACGIAHGLKVKRKTQHVFCIMGDGENDEGQIWEAAAYAPNYKLDNLIAFLDWNKKQIDGRNDDVMGLGDLPGKYSAFGWNCKVVNGNDVTALKEHISSAMKKKDEKPTVIILDTIKGAGIPCVEAIENNHCIGVPEDLARQCFLELDRQRRDLEERRSHGKHDIYR